MTYFTLPMSQTLYTIGYILQFSIIRTWPPPTPATDAGESNTDKLSIPPTFPDSLGMA